MSRPLLVFVLLGVLSCLSIPARAEPCVIPWGVVRSDSVRCAAKVRGPGQAWICADRAQFVQWLRSPSPGCWKADPGTLREFRIPLLDQKQDPASEGNRLRLVRLQGWDNPSRSRWERGVLKFIQWVERQREGFSRSVAQSDRSGWLRSWVVGERVRDVHEGVPAPVLFSLGFVHLLTTAGVHLIFLSRVIRRGVAWGIERGVSSRVLLAVRVGEALVFLWVWLLAGMRWGMLRPLALVAFSASFRRLGVQLRSPVPLILAVGFEWMLAPGSEAATHGRWHYLAAVWGGAWGAKHLEMSVGSWLWVLPLQLVHDGSLSLMNPILSLVTIPVAGVLLLPASLLAVVFPQAAPLVGNVSEFFLQLWLPLASLPGANWTIPAAALVPAGIAALAVWSWGRTGAWIAGVALAGVLLHSQIQPPRTRVLQLDVGQGDAALVVTSGSPSRAGLVDTGSALGVSIPSWLSMFSRQGVSRLDWVVLTHLDEDHAGGLAVLMPWIEIQCLVLPPAEWASERALKLRALARAHGIRVQSQASGCFPFGWAALERAGGSGRNAGMAGVRIRLGPSGPGLAPTAQYINLGDAGTRGPSREMELFLRLGLEPGLPVRFKLSHHGSRHSSSEELLKRVGPREVWISAGFSNRYGHPHPLVMQRLGALGIPWRGTWREGAISN